MSARRSRTTMRYFCWSVTRQACGATALPTFACGAKAVEWRLPGSMSETVTPAPRYKYVPYGGGVEELDRLAVRDRIRAGDITAETELALLHTDDWRAAATYPELGRYFEI